MTTLKKTLKDGLYPIFSIGSITIIMVFLIMWLLGYSKDLFSQLETLLKVMPDEYMKVLGLPRAIKDPFDLYIYVEMFTLWMAALFVGTAAAQTATIFVLEFENQTYDLMFANSQKKARIFFEKLIGFILIMLILIAIFVGSFFGFAKIYSLTIPDQNVYIYNFIALFALMLFSSSFGLVTGMVFKKVKVSLVFSWLPFILGYFSYLVYTFRAEYSWLKPVTLYNFYPIYEYLDKNFSLIMPGILSAFFIFAVLISLFIFVKTDASK